MRAAHVLERALELVEQGGHLWEMSDDGGKTVGWSTFDAAEGECPFEYGHVFRYRTVYFIDGLLIDVYDELEPSKDFWRKHPRGQKITRQVQRLLNRAAGQMDEYPARVKRRQKHEDEAGDAFIEGYQAYLSDPFSHEGDAQRVFARALELAR